MYCPSYPPSMSGCCPLEAAALPPSGATIMAVDRNRTRPESRPPDRRPRFLLLPDRRGFRVNNVPYQDSENLEEFVRQVQEHAGLDSYNEAHQLARATVRALGTSISGGQATQLAQWLPDKLQDELADKTGQASRFDKTNFLEKVAGQIHSVDLESVETQVSATLGVVRSSASAEQLEDTIAQLPRELSVMFR